MLLLPLVLACGSRSNETPTPTDTTSDTAAPTPDTDTDTPSETDSDGLPEPDPGCLEYRAEVYSDDTVCTACPAESPLKVAGVVHNTCTTTQQFTTSSGCLVTRYSITSESGEPFPVEDYGCTGAMTVWTISADETRSDVFGPHSLPAGTWTVETRFTDTTASATITAEARDTGG